MPSHFRADLHCHSTFSDGSFTPEQLLLLAKKKGLQGLSITDHDTVLAYQEALSIAKKLGIALISGVEFSSQHEGHNIHVLGYSFVIDNPDLAKLCLQHITRRKTRNLAILEKLEKIGMPISEQELLADAGGLATVGRPHIAHQMVKKGYIKDTREAFKKYIGDRQCCYVDGTYPTTEETIEVIHQAKGVAILAHPHLLNNSSLFNKLTNLPFDGLEAYYARFPPTEEQQWLDAAHSKGWLITGGSDFHGTDRPENSLGGSWTPLETFDILHALYLKNHV